MGCIGMWVETARGEKSLGGLEREFTPFQPHRCRCCQDIPWQIP